MPQIWHDTLTKTNCQTRTPPFLPSYTSAVFSYLQLTPGGWPPTGLSGKHKHGMMHHDPIQPPSQQQHKNHQQNHLRQPKRRRPIRGVILDHRTHQSQEQCKRRSQH